VHVLAFGTYQRDYPRNAQVRACLRGADVEVTEQHVDLWDRRRDAWSVGIGSLGRIALAEARLAARRRDSADALLVGYPGHVDMAAARIAARGRPIVFDPLVSLYDTLVSDRGRFRPGSAPARTLLRLDRAAFRSADIVVADTEANATFYADRLGVDADRIRVCLVGAEDRLFHAESASPRPFHALFVGKLIPLHGLDTILEAARLTPEVRYRIVGSGQLQALLARAPANVDHVPWVEYGLLPAELRSAGCALGIFGTSGKAARVIPNKAFQALACATPLVTADTSAARELLTDGVDSLLVQPGDPAALANAVAQLAADPDLRGRLGNAGRATYEACASETVLGGRWRSIFGEVVAT
jgi:glycosyltransferase involved in cell wall biosynthesis